jgi:hypothetical protein
MNNIGFKLLELKNESCQFIIRLLNYFFLKIQNYINFFK